MRHFLTDNLLLTVITYFLKMSREYFSTLPTLEKGNCKFFDFGTSEKGVLFMPALIGVNPLLKNWRKQGRC